MPAAGWMRRWRGGRGAGVQASAPVLAAARGEPLSELLSLGARRCWPRRARTAPGCGSAGIGGEGLVPGCVVEAVPGPIPEQWKRLDVHNSVFADGA